MKKYLLLIVILIIFTGVTSNATENEKIYDDYIKKASEYQYGAINIEEDINDYTNLYKKLLDIAADAFYSQFKKYINLFLVVTLVCIVSSVINSFAGASSIKDVVEYVTVVIFGVYFLTEFKALANLGFKTIRDLTEYMNISLPGLTLMLSASGYSSTARVMHSLFIFISNIMAIVVNKVFYPIIYMCSILTISNGVCNSDDINKITKTLIKFLKYAFTILLTIFSAVLTITGFTAGSADGIAIKTAKYAISNFVPIVGSCLSETLNSIINSSLLLKNSAGYICIIVILIICLVPIIKIFITSCVIKLLSFVTTFLSNDKMTILLEKLSEIITLIGALIIFLTIIFMLMLGIIASLGG